MFNIAVAHTAEWGRVHEGWEELYVSNQGSSHLDLLVVLFREQELSATRFSNFSYNPESWFFCGKGPGLKM